MMIDKKWFLLLLLGLFLKESAFSQTNNKIGNWLIYSSQIRVHDKWSIHAEAQYRDYGIFDEAEQILLRGGINYHYNAQTIITAGYGRITNFTDDNILQQSPSAAENRIWQQLILRSNVGRCLLEHRYRLEQRWINSNNTTRYLDRVRYCLRATIPLNKKEMVKNTVFLSFYNEVFIHFSSTPFDRNRLYGALGYQISPLVNVQLGYLAQTVNIKTKQYLQAALFYNFDLRKKK